MPRSITIATVTAPKFVEHPESPFPRNLTPRLHLKLNYDEGTRSRPRAYTLTMFHDRISDDGFASVIIDFQPNPTAIIEVANRFSQAKLDKLVANVYRGEFKDTIDKLYEMAVEKHNRHHWPLSIMTPRQLVPADGFADGGCAYTEEELAQ